MPETDIKHFQCRHIFTDGHRCGSKCLRNQDFCYYHHGARQPKPAPDLYLDTHSSFELPAPEDRSAIQAGIGIIVQRISSGRLDSKRAGLLLYALQIASLNLPKSPATVPESVEDITLDDQNQALAPVNELIPPAKEKTLEEIVMEHWYMEASAEPEVSLPDCQSDWSCSEPYREPRSRRTPLRPAPPNSPANAGLAAQTIPEPCAANPPRNRSEFYTFVIPTLHATASDSGRRKAHPEGWAHPVLCRRSPNLPHTYACSTIGPTRLNFRVRDGNGCDPRGKLTGKPENFALAIFHN